ncbi:hypothetical protein [Pseudonocardia sp. TMWB2A]|uniref:hypothetical protein n=1 Tax=Pseudonocardia sp. TMWB2A TaxID=687430 RepID=UPI00307F61B1
MRRDFSIRFAAFAGKGLVRTVAQAGVAVPCKQGIDADKSEQRLALDPGDACP